MIRAILSLICAVCISCAAYAGTKPESLEEQSYNGNTMFNEELDGKAFLNGRLIVRVERISTCVSAVWTRSDGIGSPLRRDLLEWDKMFDADPSNDARSYYLTFVYADVHLSSVRCHHAAATAAGQSDLAACKFAVVKGF
ncbi:hypothetical protein [Acetobacter sp. LMG 32666]|uniref:hypothetical protein n=1 Tax=Acetobacter sp. LMG 32666 TaxID=2959295 RepID=UPI0030C87C99